ncbi:AAA family ATPase [Kistimonas asteriae]|uniref:AAA family ATPase n=1 Tax=Kistimonas asteriae TaxID=517724 RepID=UPI001BA5F6C8|nr:AAA family ATPase [Kistimonas asteriae]
MASIIAIAGPPGCGKSTLSRAIATHLDASIIDYDHYQTVTDHPVESIIEWLDKGLDYNALTIPGLSEDLARLKHGQVVTPPSQPFSVSSRNIILFETPFGYCHAESARHIDLMLWIDIPLDIALARNIRAFTEHFTRSKHTSPATDNIHWLQEYMDNYINSVHDLLTKQIEKVRPQADYMIDGKKDVATTCQQALKIIQGWTHNKIAREVPLP